MNQDDVKALADRQAQRARGIAKAGVIAKPATPAKPAAAAQGPRPVPAPALRLLKGGREVGEIIQPTQPRRMKVSDEVLGIAKARGRPPATVDQVRAFSAYQPAPGVLPPRRKIATDEALPGVAWANQSMFLDVFALEGMQFLGYPYLSSLMQRTEYRRAAERLATEMTRKWIKLNSTGEEDKGDKIKELDAFLKELKLKERATQLALLDNGFGRAHLYLDTGDTDDPAELKKPIGNGRNRWTKAKIKKGSLKRLQVVEPTWCYPARYNANNPLAPDWYKPETWFCMQNEIHRSRLLTFVGRPVPDLLKPSYAFGGLALTQMLKPYVDNWLDVRQSIARLIQRFSTSGIKLDMQNQLSPTGDGGPGGSQDFWQRVDLFVTMAKNEGLLVLDKNTEEFFQQNVPLGTLDQLQAQAQEQMASACGIPVVVLLGLTPHGLNACLTGDTLIETNEGFIQILDVRPGQKVMTRKGWAPVAKAGCTAYATELIEIETDESVIRCTPEHKIWIPSINAFVPAENVSPGDILLHRRVAKKTNTANQSYGEECTGGIAATATIPQPDRTKGKPSFTGRFGAFTTGLFQEVATFITSTRTAETINSVISSYLAPKRMHECTALPRGFSSGSHPAMNANVAIAGIGFWSERLRELSFAAIGADLPTGAKKNHHRPNLVQSAFAVCAEFLFKQKGKTQSTALGDAQQQARTDHHTVANITDKTKENGSRNTTSETLSVVCSVRRVPAQEFVYDIQVASGYLPEFFANGICVHNSSEGEIRAFEDWVAAYQPQFYGDSIQRVLDFAMISLWGEVDEEIGYEWVPLHSLDEKGVEDVQKSKADRDVSYVDRGVLDPLEVRRRLAADPSSGYNGIDVEDVPEPPDDGGGEGGAEPSDIGEQETPPDNEPPEGKNTRNTKFSVDAQAASSEETTETH